MRLMSVSSQVHTRHLIKGNGRSIPVLLRAAGSMVPEPSISSFPRPFTGPGTEAEEVYMTPDEMEADGSTVAASASRPCFRVRLKCENQLAVVDFGCTRLWNLGAGELGMKEQ